MKMQSIFWIGIIKSGYDCYQLIQLPSYINANIITIVSVPSRVKFKHLELFTSLLWIHLPLFSIGKIGLQIDNFTWGGSCSTWVADPSPEPEPIFPFCWFLWLPLHTLNVQNSQNPQLSSTFRDTFLASSTMTSTEITRVKCNLTWSWFYPILS